MFGVEAIGTTIRDSLGYSSTKGRVSPAQSSLDEDDLLFAYFLFLLLPAVTWALFFEAAFACFSFAAPLVFLPVDLIPFWEPSVVIWTFWLPALSSEFRLAESAGAFAPLRGFKAADSEAMLASCLAEGSASEFSCEALIVTGTERATIASLAACFYKAFSLRLAAAASFRF